MAKTTRLARQRVLEAAAALFFRDGYRAVGVDTIVAESGVGKMTLYRHFPSKDALVAASLRDSDEKFWVWFNAASAGPASARERLLGVFRALEKLVSSPACYGCPFLNAAVDFPEPGHPGHQVALAHKQDVRARFHELARQAGARSPKALADQLLLLMDGAFMAVRVYGAENPATRVSQAARVLVDAQVKRG